MTPYARRGVHGQSVEALARRIVGGELPAGAAPDLVVPQSGLDIGLTALNESLNESLNVPAAKDKVDAHRMRDTSVRAHADRNLLDADVPRRKFEGGTAEADRQLPRTLGEARAITEPADVRRPDAGLPFHRALLAATHDALLEHREAVIESSLARHDRSVHGSPRSVHSVPAHRAVPDAVRDREPPVAEAATRDLSDQAGRDPDRVDTPDDTKGNGGT
ncbi:GntR family transcriptional regulator [Streptomyces sp. NPDC006393]|uniref:GntR family transcriptional regulator n=1 Tax=Streptomyces sp. NPDC006393 TaxID=3156763 RepID=UPI0033C5A136